MTAPAQRLDALKTWLAAHTELGEFEIEPLSADASFRRYYRVHSAGHRFIAMDAPPDKEKPAEFLIIAERLLELGLSAPRALAAEPGAGYLLLEDLGDRTYTRALAEGADETALYHLAVDTLIELHRRWRPELGAGIPPYDEAALLAEASLLVDWYWPAVLGAPCPEGVRDAFFAAWRAVLPAAQALPPTLVLRDYHVDNLMVLDGREGVAACGLLDFQDALLGSPAYDLVSLLRDARRDVPAELGAAMLDHYLAAFPTIDREAFETAYWVLGAQRTTKVIGIFTRLDRRDGKPIYLYHLPRLWRLLGKELAQPALAPVSAWYDRHLPPELRRVPEAGSAA